MRDAGLVEVRIVDLPLETMRQSRQHHDALVRELELIAHEADPQDASSRLLDLAVALRQLYAAFVDAPTRRLTAATRRDDESVTVVYQVAPGVADTARALLAALDDADEHCRTGALLTLVAPDDVASFRRWFLGEFTRQVGGAAPTPWSESPSRAS